MAFEIHYRKHDNRELFESLILDSELGLDNLQYYNPLYELFFVYNDTNYGSAILNPKWLADKAETPYANGAIGMDIVSKDGNHIHRDSFVKISPIVDPVKFATGKIEGSLESILRVPTWKKALDAPANTYSPYNVPYIDGFFSYLSSQLLNNHNIIHGLDYYGSIIGRQAEFKYNAIDDIEVLEDSSYFLDNIDKLFTLDPVTHQELTRGSMKKKPKLTFASNGSEELGDIMELEDLSENGTEIQNLINTGDLVDLNETFLDSEALSTLDGLPNNDSQSESSSGYCSSRSSVTSSSGSTSNSDNDNDSDSSSDCESEDETPMLINMKNFPVHLSFLEKCESTLDSLIVHSDENPIEETEWESLLFQIIVTLYSYQKAFLFTHNDLHSNNIMYTKTERPYLYYKIEGMHYKIPTFGKIFKIIDFGRSIYKFRGEIIASSSFGPKGEAEGQYNCEPFLDDNKPRIDPNFSFDLCRLATSIYDYIVGESEEEVELPILRIIINWCKDDKGRNVLYKSNGEERYPDFKLYKMIARTVHNHTPAMVLRDSIFRKFVVPRKSINKSQRIMNIDKLPCYT